MLRDDQELELPGAAPVRPKPRLRLNPAWFSNIPAFEFLKKLFGAHAQPPRASLTIEVLMVDRSEMEAVVR